MDTDECDLKSVFSKEVESPTRYPQSTMKHEVIMSLELGVLRHVWLSSLIRTRFAIDATSLESAD